MNLLNKVAFIFIGIFLIILVLFFLSLVQQGQRVVSKSSNNLVLGDLGGVAVEIPKEYARFVEYNKELHFMDKKTGLKMVGTHQSKLRSFGFEVRYPDMAFIKGKANKEEKNIHTTMWLRVGINTGEYYGVENYLNRKKERYLNSASPCFTKCFIYHSLPNDIHGLVGYTPTGTGVDVEKRSINSGRGTDMRDKNIYFVENSPNHVSTFITCSNVTHAAAPCTQYFSLSPKMKANVRVSYRKGLLSDWKEIQQSISQLIYNFEVDVNAATENSLNKRN